MLVSTPYCRVLVAALAIGLAAAAQDQSQVDAFGTHPARQILWQRSLPDALQLSEQLGRPLLIALNMDGESASDRIINELYRDPRFVALTRRCVCLVASVFRHSALDHDDAGRRIPCPRLGEVTCGEHMALEPLVYEKYLSDGERVAPRHALILREGKKAWDISLSFDLRDIERSLVESVGGPESQPESTNGAEFPAMYTKAVFHDPAAWTALAKRRDHRGRAALERSLAATLDQNTEVCTLALAALRQNGDEGALEALRIVGAKLSSLPDPVVADLIATARALDLQDGLAAALREGVQSASPSPGSLQTLDCEAVLPIIAELNTTSRATRALLVTCRALKPYENGAAAGLRRVLDAREVAAVDGAVEAAGGVVALRYVLAQARAITEHGWFPAASRPAEPLPRPSPITDAMPEVAVLERSLAESERLLKVGTPDPALMAQHAKVCLDLGRRRLEAQQDGATTLLEDADLWYQRATEREPDHAAWWIEHARAAYFLGHFADEAAFGERAFRIARHAPAGPLPNEGEVLHDLPDDGIAIEALRWIGDGNARLLVEATDPEPARDLTRLIAAARALSLVAISPFATTDDWAALVSLFETRGMSREAVAIAQEAAMRQPTVWDVRELLNRALWSAGFLDDAPRMAELISERAGPRPEVQSLAGYAWMLAAEQDRRKLPADAPFAAYAALSEYATARARYRSIGSDAPAALSAQSRTFVALSWFGSAMAHLSIDRRADAADCLVAGVTADPSSKSGHDGLGCDVFDVVDRIFEWRETSECHVDPRTLLDRLEAADPGTPFWALAISDTQLREALRADGRNPEKVVGETVDASGELWYTWVGLPTVEGDVRLREAIVAARHALATADSDETRRQLAQVLTITGERSIARGRPREARGPLAEAAGLMKVDPVAPDARDEAWQALSDKLRGLLGAARPRLRPGR